MESGWGDGPHTGPSSFGDPKDREKDEPIEEDEAVDDLDDDDDDEDEDDDESVDDEDEEDASEEGHQRAGKKRGQKSRREKNSGKAMQGTKGKGCAHETSSNLSLAVRGNSSRGENLAKVNYKVLKDEYDPAHPTDELEEMAVVDLPISDSPKGDDYDPAHPTDELDEKRESKVKVCSVEDQFGVDKEEKCEPDEFDSQDGMHKEKADRRSVEGQFSIDNKGRQKVEKAYFSATEEMHKDKLERDSVGEVKYERPKGKCVKVSNEKDCLLQNILEGEEIRVGNDSCVNDVDGQKGAQNNVEHIAQKDAGKDAFHLEEEMDLDSSFDVGKELVSDLTDGSQADRSQSDSFKTSSLNTTLDTSLNTTLDTSDNLGYKRFDLTVQEEEDDIAEEEDNKGEVVESAVNSETVELVEDVGERSLEKMDAESVEDKQDVKNESKEVEHENEAESPDSSHDEEKLEEMEVLDKGLLSEEAETENDKNKWYNDLEGNYNEHKIKAAIASDHDNFNVDCSQELEENKNDTESEGDKEKEFKDVRSKNNSYKDERSAESMSSYVSSEDPVQKEIQKAQGIEHEDSDDLAVSGNEAQDWEAKFEQDESGSHKERNDDTLGEEEEEEKTVEEMDTSDASKDENYNVGSRHKERGEDHNSKEIRKNHMKDIAVEDENEEGELPKDSIDSPDEEKVREDEYRQARIRRKVELKKREKARRQNELKVRKSENKDSVSKSKHKKISVKEKKLKKKVADEEGEDGELHEKAEPSVKFNVIKHKKPGKDMNKSQRKYRHYRRSNSAREDFDFEEHDKHEIEERIIYEKHDSHSKKSKETKKRENKGIEINSSRRQDRERGERDKFLQQGEEGEWDNGEIEEGEFVEKTDYYRGDYYSRENENLIDDYFSKIKEKNYHSKEKEKLKEDCYMKGKEKVKEDYHLKDKEKLKEDYSSKEKEREKRKKSHKKEKEEQPPKPQSAKHQLPPPPSKEENKVEEDSDDDVQIVYVELSPWAHIPKMVQPKPIKKTTDSKQSRLLIKVSQNNEDRTVWKEKQKTKEKENVRDHGRGDRDKDRRRERGRDADRKSRRHRFHSRNRESRSKDHSRRSRDGSRRRRNERSRSRSTDHSSHDRSYKRQRRNRSRDMSLSRERDWTKDRWSKERERSLDHWSPDRYRQRWSRERLSRERSRERWSRGRSLERWSLERDISMGRSSRERDISGERYRSPEILFDRRDLYGEEMKSPSPIRPLKVAKPSKKKGKEKQKEKEVVAIIVESESPVKVKKKRKVPKGEKKAVAKKRKVEVIESPELPELPPELPPEKEDDNEFAVEEPIQDEDIEMNEKIARFTPEELDLSEDDSNDRLVIATEPEPEESGREENEEEISDDERINRIENMQFRDPREGKSAPLMTKSKDYDPAHPTDSPIFDEGPDEDKVETRQGRIEPRLGKHPVPAAGDAFTTKPFPPPPLNSVVSQAAITTQVPISGPPGHGLLGQGPPLLPIPASGVPLPLGLNVPPPGLQPGLPGPPPPRPLMAPPFMNRPPPSHLPPISEPVSQVRWSVSTPPGIVSQFRSRMAGDIGHPLPGLYDDLPPETAPVMPLPVDSAHSVAISVAQTMASTILPQPVPIPDTHPQGPPPQPVHHLSSHESLPLSNHEDLQHPQPQNLQTKPPVSLSTVVTSVSGTSPRMAIPRSSPSGEVIPGIGQISNLLAPAQLAIFGASEGTGKRMEHRDSINDTSLFKVPLPPSSFGKATDGATKPFDRVETSEVVDMDISSPSEDECSIELQLSPKAQKSHSKTKEKRDSKRREKRDSKKGSVSERKEFRSKSKESVVAVDSSLSSKESFGILDTIFLKDSKESEKAIEGLKESKKLRTHHKHRHRRHKERKEKSPQEMDVNDTQNELIEQVDEPSSAVDLTNKEKYLRKLHLQERVVDELKLALKPHYASKNIDKEQYKDILRKAVPKVCKSKDVNPAKIRKLVDAYVEKYQKKYETLDDDDESTLLEESENSGDENAETCPICLNRLRDQDIGMPETCDHTFCLECIQEWAKNVNTCPVDRQVFRLILAKHPGQDKIFKKFPVEEHNILEEEEVADEDDVTYCEVCNQCDREDKLLLCDGCDLGYHMDCLTPPLRRVPVEEWFCPECEATSSSQSVAEVIDDFEETSELIAENRDQLMPTRLRANVTTTQAQAVRQSQRRIPRTLLSERVREAIEETRRRRIRRILSSSEEDGEEEEEEDEIEETMEEESTTETSTSTTAKKKTARKRKTTRKRKTARRKTKGKKRKTTKRRKRKTKTGKRKTGKRRVKKRRRKTVRTVQDLRERAGKPHTPLTVKGRIAGALGLSKPPPGRTIPLQKLPGDKSLDMRRSEVGITSLSIFGSRDQLDPTYEDEDIPQPGGSKVAAESQQQSHSRHSRSALYSHKPIGRIPARLKAKFESTSKPVESISTSAACEGSMDILGSIMQGQTVLHMQDKDVTIHRDGSLSTKKPIENPTPKNKSKDSSEGRELPSLFGSISKNKASNEQVMQSKGDKSNKAGNVTIAEENDIKDSKEVNSSLTEAYDPAHPTDDLEETDEIPMQTDSKTSLEDEYDPAHPTDEMEEETVEELKEEIIESKEVHDHQVKNDNKENKDDSVYGKDVKNVKDEENSKNSNNVNINDPKSKYSKDMKNKSNSIKIKLKTDSKFLSSFNAVESSSLSSEKSMVKIEVLSEISVGSTEKDWKGSEENLLESSKSESKQISSKISSKEVIDMFADDSVEGKRDMIEIDIVDKNSGEPSRNEEKDRINYDYNCDDSKVMEGSLIGDDAEKVNTNVTANHEENDASNSKLSDGSETDRSKHNMDVQESANQGKVDLIDKEDKVGDGENVNEKAEAPEKEEDEAEDDQSPAVDYRSIAQVLQLLATSGATSGEEQTKVEDGEKESEKDKVSMKGSQDRDRRERHHDRDKSRDKSRDISDNRKHRHRRSRSRDRKSRSRDKRSRSQEKRSQDKRSRSHDKSRRSRSRDRSRKKHDRSRSRSKDRKRKRNRDRSQERSRSKERSKSNERDSSRSLCRSKDRDLDKRSSNRHSDEFEKENAYYARQERQREIRSLMDIDVSAGMKRMRDRTDHANVDHNEKLRRYMDEETTEEERIDQIENMHCSTERTDSPNSDHERRRRRGNWRSLPENRELTTSLDSSSPVDNSIEFFEEEEGPQESLLGRGPAPVHIVGKPLVGSCFPPPPPPPPPPPATLIVGQDSEMIQVSGPPGQGLLGEGPLILQGPHPGDSSLFQHRMPIPLGLNVVPPRFHQHLGPHQRHILFNPFLNRPPISRFHLPGGPQLGWPPQMIPFGARIAPEGIVGPAGLYDSLPPETALSQPLLPPQGETLSNVMVPTSEAILLPVPLNAEGAAMMPSSIPRPHPMISLPLQPPPPPHSAISVTDTIRTSAIITTAAPQLLTTSNVTESSHAPKPTGGIISIKLQELSQLLNTQARLATLTKNKDNSVDRNSERTSKLSEQKDDNVFKVPLPPPPSGAKTSNRNNINSGEVIIEVVDMDMSSPTDNEGFIELPESDDHQSKLTEQKNNENEANQTKIKSEAKENRQRNHDSNRKKRDKKGTEDNAEIQKNTAQSESDVTSSAKFVKKLQIQERVVAEVKDAIKPHYSCRRINKDQYKEILRKAVPKICHSANTKNGEVHSEKIKALVDAYVEKFHRKKGEAIALDSPD